MAPSLGGAVGQRLSKDKKIYDLRFTIWNARQRQVTPTVAQSMAGSCARGGGRGGLRMSHRGLLRASDQRAIPIAGASAIGANAGGRPGDTGQLEKSARAVRKAARLRGQRAET